jgi:DNA-binding HxlR family transcriptional regulator
MRPTSYPNAFVAQCPTREVLDRISNKWVSLLLVALAAEPLGHRELLRRIEGVSQKMLTQTLRDLERDGIVSFTRTDSNPPRSSYRLTDLGETLLPVLAAVKSWAETHMPEVLEARVYFDGQRGNAAETG